MLHSSHERHVPVAPGQNVRRMVVASTSLASQRLNTWQSRNWLAKKYCNSWDSQWFACDSLVLPCFASLRMLSFLEIGCIHLLHFANSFYVLPIVSRLSSTFSRFFHLRSCFWPRIPVTLVFVAIEVEPCDFLHLCRACAQIVSKGIGDSNENISIILTIDRPVLNPNAIKLIEHVQKLGFPNLMVLWCFLFMLKSCIFWVQFPLWDKPNWFFSLRRGLCKPSAYWVNGSPFSVFFSSLSAVLPFTYWCLVGNGWERWAWDYDW